MDFSWLYVDLNSYFASVEQQLNPKLRGKPVAVVPMLANSTCVIAASYEAKKFGIKTGTMVGDAKKMCPGLICIEGKHGEYVRYHQKIMAAVESAHPISAVCSIDEVACRLGGRDQKFANAVALAHEVKQKIYQVGEIFHCSIGLAPNRFLAKVASDMQKPNGLTTLTMADLPHKLFTLKPRDFVGIGRQMEARLQQVGIHTTEQLYNLSSNEMRKIWGGVCGEIYFKWLRGENIETSHRSDQSIGHQHVLPPDLRTPRGGYLVGQKLLNKAAVRLRKIKSWTRRMVLGVRYTDHSRWNQDIKFIECQDTFTLQEVFDQLWRVAPRKPVLKISVTLCDFVHDNERTFSFFENPKRHRLSFIMDQLNVRFGKNTIYLGSIAEALNAAPTRIAFSSIPDMEI